MSKWTEHALETIGSTEECEIAARRDDGSLAPFVIVWAVRVDDAIYLRSVKGTAARWYRDVMTTQTGVIRAGDEEVDVQFTSDDSRYDALDAAYLQKFGSTVDVDAICAPRAKETSLRLSPLASR